MMPLYFIDSSDGERDVHDEVGHDLRDRDAARAEALAALADMARDKIPHGDDRVLTVTVRARGDGDLRRQADDDRLLEPGDLIDRATRRRGRMIAAARRGHDG